ncbi:MAG TPA: hypothetical protein VEW95_05620 [Candidatus Limnocylindrales bacterium]|nr:hypothetical protein [Candidatus Limnocylindrales bacterium]
MTAKKKTTLDLRYTGGSTGGARVNRVPARDLTPHDVDRLVYARTIPTPGSRGLRRGDDGFPQARAKLTRELLRSGVYAKPKEKKS